MFMKSNKETQTQKIKIPARSNAPETELFVKIVAHSSSALDTRPVIFILPGGPGLDHSTYQAYNCLFDVANIVYHDPRGCGKSDKNNPNTYTAENYIEDIEALRQSLDLKKIIPIGKSFGSVCAMGYALRYQDAIDKLVLSAGAPSFHSLHTAKENLLKIATPKQIERFETLWNGQFKSNKELANFYAETAPLYSKHIKTRLEIYVLTYFSKNFCHEALNLGFTDFLRRFDFRDQLHQINRKTLILAGKDDWINDIKHLTLMAEKIPNSVFKVFENAGHAIESDIGKDYFDTIRQFILQ